MKSSGLPKEYKLKKLGDLVEIKTGKLDANAAVENGEYPFFTCSINPLRIDSYSYECECVLVAGNGDLNVKYYDGKFDAYQRTYIIESKDTKYLDTKYLYYFMSKYINILRNESIGGVIKYIKLGNLTDAKIPVPAFQTQMEIVQVLEKAEKALDKRKEANRLLDEYLMSVFVEMFGDPIRNENKYEIKKLETLCYKITDGTHKTPVYFNEGVKFISAKNISDGKIDWVNTKFISNDEHETLIKRCKPLKGDILLTKSGSIGTAVIVDEEMEFSIFESLALLKYNKELLAGDFFVYCLNHPYTKNQYMQSTKGASIKHLHLKEIKNIKIIVPPTKLQDEFGNIVHRVNKIKQKNLKELMELENLFNSLMKDAFK